MPSEKEKALVLPEDAATSSEPVVFPPFPGIYTPGVPVAISALGFASIADAREAMAAVGDLPLKETSVDAGSAPVQRANHVPSEAEAKATGYEPKRGEPGGPLEEGEGFPLAPAQAEAPVAPELSPTEPAPPASEGEDG